MEREHISIKDETPRGRSVGEVIQWWTTVEEGISIGLDVTRRALINGVESAQEGGSTYNGWTERDFLRARDILIVKAKDVLSEKELMRKLEMDI